LQSNVFTGNDLAQMAGLYEFPSDMAIEELMTMDADIQKILIASEAPDDTMLESLHGAAKKALEEGNPEKAFAIAMIFESVG